MVGSGVIPKGHEEAESQSHQRGSKAELEERLTISKGNQAKRGPTKDTRVDSVQLSRENTIQLGVPRGALAVGRARNNPTDIQSIAWVSAVRERVGDQRIRVRHTGGLGKVDHRVRVILLVAWVRVGEEGVDTPPLKRR